jgi:Tfp pilus assembly protein PilW
LNNTTLASRRRQRRGITLIELSIGLLITAMVIGALSALWFAVGEQWRKSSSSQSATLRASQAVVRLEGTFRQAKYLCQYTPGSITDAAATPASAFFWRADFWNALGDVTKPQDFKNSFPDGLVQVAELTLVEYDASAKRIYLYQAKDPAAMDAAQRTAAGTVWTWTDLSKPMNLTAFKALNYVTRTVLSEGVAAAAFNMPTPKTGGRPLLEFTLKLPRAGGNTLVYSAATFRTPAPKPS